jgi:Lipopolysaccharide-assembly
MFRNVLRIWSSNNKKGRRSFLRPWATILFLLLPCCGYTLKHRIKEAFTVKGGIFIPVFDNLTDETGTEKYFTDALIRELISRREVVVSGKQEAGVELRGILQKIEVAPTAYSNLGFGGMPGYRRLPSELGVRVTLWLTLYSKTGQELWGKQFVGFRRVDAPLNRTFDYQAASATGMFSQSVWEAIYPDIARDMMRDVYDELVDFF